MPTVTDTDDASDGGAETSVNIDSRSRPNSPANNVSNYVRKLCLKINIAYIFLSAMYVCPKY